MEDFKKWLNALPATPTFPFKEREVKLAKEFECSYGSAARKKAKYPVGMTVTAREWKDGSVELLDGMYVVSHNAVKGEDYTELD